MYSFSYLEPVCCSMSSSNCCFLTWIQVSQKAGKVVWYSHFSQNFSQFIVIHTVKGFGIVYKAEVDVFLELSCFPNDPMDVGNLISGSSAFSKFSLNIWKFTVHVLLKPGLQNFEHYFTSVWDECNCAVVWAFFGITFLWDWNENWSVFRLKWKKVGKTTRPFRYDLNQILYDYTVEVTNRFKGLDMIDRVPEELWIVVHDIVQEAEI